MPFFEVLVKVVGVFVTTNLLKIQKIGEHIFWDKAFWLFGDNIEY